jgi:hypothetical protein
MNPTGKEVKEASEFLVNDIIKIREDAYEKYSFKNSMKQTITRMFYNLVIPHLLKCIEKYGEEGFHKIMYTSSYIHNNIEYTGFDFITDWQKNHRKKWIMASALAKANREVIDLNRDLWVQKIIGFLEIKGWKIYPSEVQCITHTIESLKTSFNL